MTGVRSQALHIAAAAAAVTGDLRPGRRIRDDSARVAGGLAVGAGAAGRLHRTLSGRRRRYAALGRRRRSAPNPVPTRSFSAIRAGTCGRAGSTISTGRPPIHGAVPNCSVPTRPVCWRPRWESSIGMPPRFSPADGVPIASAAAAGCAGPREAGRSRRRRPTSFRAPIRRSSQSSTTAPTGAARQAGGMAGRLVFDARRLRRTGGVAGAVRDPGGAWGGRHHRARPALSGQSAVAVPAIADARFEALGDPGAAEFSRRRDRRRHLVPP